jgi:hypothetical protein
MGGFADASKFKLSLMDMDAMNPESIKNAASAYQGAVAEENKYSDQMLADQLQYMMYTRDEWEAQNGGPEAFEGMIDQLRTENEKKKQDYASSMMEEFIKNLVPQIQDNTQGMKTDQLAGLSDTITSLINGTNPEGMTEKQKANYDYLAKLRDYLNALKNNKYENADLLFSDLPSLPPAPFPQQEPVSPYDPFLHEGGGGGGSKLSLMGADVQIDNPKLQMSNVTFEKSGLDGMEGRGEQFGSIESTTQVNITPAPVSVTIDGQTLARLVIRYLPKVEAQRGSYVGGSSSWVRETQ